MTKQEVFDQCRIEGTTVFLPEVQLDRKLYTEVNKGLQGIGGKWNRKAKGFVFSEDPAPLLGRVQAGEKVNLKKEFQAFFTPTELADRVVELAEITEKDTILEPSAGTGALLDAVLRKLPIEPSMIAVELQERNTIVLAEKYQMRDVAIYNTDFLEFANECDGTFTSIIANPPFTKNQDIKHFMSMYDLLSPKGVMVCIMSTGWLRNSTKICKNFRAFLGIDEPSTDVERWQRNLAQNGGSTITTEVRDFEEGYRDVHIETVESGAFKESGTNVATCIVKLKKLL